MSRNASKVSLVRRMLRGVIYAWPVGFGVGALLAYDKISLVSAVLLIVVLGAGSGFLADRAGRGRGTSLPQ